MANIEKASQRILIIDDDAQIRDLLNDFLSEKYDCTEASSAEDALAVLNQSDFDLVLSDINMGGISGLDLVPHVRELAPETVVVMISGQQGIETAIESMHVGAFDYITKPFDLRHVEAAVRRALGQRKLLVEKRLYENNLEELVKQRTAQVERLAYYDTLTGLPNRALFADRLDQALATAQRNQQMVSMLFVSVDRFKKIKAPLGQSAGDLLLKE